MKRYITADICVCCGALVCEGRQVCSICEENAGTYPISQKPDTVQKISWREQISMRLSNKKKKKN